MRTQVACTRGVNIADAMATNEKRDAPLRPDLGDGSDVRLRGEHELVEDNPLGRRLEPARGVERNDLVVLHGQIRVLLALLVCDLHEEAADERLADVLPQPSFVLRRDELNLVPLHRALQLLADVLGLLQGPLGEVVVPTPLAVVLVC